MPGDVLNNGRVSSENGLGINDLVFFGCSIDIPQADGVIVTGGQEMTVQVRVPRQAIAFLLVASQTQVRDANAVRVGFGGVLGIVENQDVTRRGLGGDDARVLGHAASPVDLSLVVDLDFDLDFSGNGSESSEFAFLVVVVRCVELGVLVGQLK
jgi:hypothetical protein